MGVSVTLAGATRRVHQQVAKGAARTQAVRRDPPRPASRGYDCAGGVDRRNAVLDPQEHRAHR